jgi:hypothetical protein
LSVAFTSVVVVVVAVAVLGIAYAGGCTVTPAINQEIATHAASNVGLHWRTGKNFCWDQFANRGVGIRG